MMISPDVSHTPTRIIFQLCGCVAIICFHFLLVLMYVCLMDSMFYNPDIIFNHLFFWSFFSGINIVLGCVLFWGCYCSLKYRFLINIILIVLNVFSVCFFFANFTSFSVVFIDLIGVIILISRLCMGPDFQPKKVKDKEGK